MGAAGFDAVETREVWWLHQVTSGVKPKVASVRAERVPCDAAMAAINYTVNYLYPHQQFKILV
ncbi:MAG: hypothetical protein GDA43_05755 [Hormoscilla sp. SP5CHS1]|nr:hypothetical protein [Hormoscilla sp. SP5CHS1]MBC6471916.1 hypothetical protein [Hormoscilla sp. GM102CHS1]